jgi:hypothetical protein
MDLVGGKHGPKRKHENRNRTSGGKRGGTETHAQIQLHYFHIIRKIGPVCTLMCVNGELVLPALE